MPNNFRDFRSMQALYSDSNCRRTARTGNRQHHVEIRIEGHNNGSRLQGPSKDFIVIGVRHSDFTHMGTFISDIAQTARGITRDSLIEQEAENRLPNHAASLSVARSSRLAAANASACRTSSGSSSG